jgi:lysophospholipase L1-like esterase
VFPPPDASANLSRSEAALHSNGALSTSHYDMNLVYIDTLMRHLMWTGDLDYARQVWPVIERHLAWERRLFRREFASGGLPLYEAYAAIWTSDDLEYHGGGVAYASAYNYFHNRMAAWVARLLGHDAGPYEREAEAIARGMRAYLWLEDRGAFAEFKDLLGLQLVHPGAGLWTFYHTMDAGLPTPFEAWRMTRAVDTRIPHLPVRGTGVPAEASYAVLSTTDWMPYTWSANNVVMGENIHTALGFWQAGRPEEAFGLMKSALLASMFTGICPGNVGSMNDLDVYRRESQRDFGDGSGVFARALVEGLFGIHPDALEGTLRVAPGFPEAWDHARLQHPDVTLDYRRSGMTEEYTIESRFPMPLSVTLDVPARRARVASVTVNGRPASWRAVEHAVVHPRIEIPAGAVPRIVMSITWTGEALRRGRTPDGDRAVRKAQGMMSWWEPVETAVPVRRVEPARAVDCRTPEPGPVRWEMIDLASSFNDRVTEIFKPGKYVSPRSPFCSLAIPSQGIGAWAGHVNAMAEIDDRGVRDVAGRNGGRLVLPNGVPFITDGPGDAKNIVFTSQWDNYPRQAVVPLSGRARTLYLLMAGSTNHMQSRLDNGEVIVIYADGLSSRLALHNPTTWWPIDQDYFIDDFAFARPEPIPPRIDLKTGNVRLLDPRTFKGTGGLIPGGAATALALPLDPANDLRSLTVRALANEVVIGLMAATLARPEQPVPARFSFGASGGRSHAVIVAPSLRYSDERGYGFEPGSQPPRFSVRVPEEGNYRVTVTAGGVPAASSTAIRAELRRLMVERLDTSPGRTETVTFIVNTRTPVIRATGGVEAGEVALKAPRETTIEETAWDQRLTLEFGGAKPAVAALEIVRANVPTVFLLGDSTVCDQPAAPYASWGQTLPRFFQPSVAIANHAESGESYRDSLSRRRLDKILSVMKPGDYVFMQFGHNDQKQVADGTGGPFTTYMAELQRHVEAVRTRRGVPVVVSPVERRAFDDAGRFVPSLAEYAEAARRAAQQSGVAFIDLNAMSKTFYEALGPQRSAAAFAEPEPGRTDNSHHSVYGAYELAKCVLLGIRRARLGLATHIVRNFRGFDPARPDPIDRLTLGF